MSKVEKSLELARRSGDEFLSTFDAASALDRARSLLEDIALVKDSFDRTPPKVIFEGWRSFSVDIVSYYSVAFVTCLEWHARSRLANLIAHYPHLVRADDLKQDLNTKALARVISENISIPHFIGIAMNVSSAEHYLSIFDRVFGGVESKEKASKIIEGLEADSSGIRRLESIFESRHELVHEISSAQVGHPFFHEYLNLDGAAELGSFVLRCMEALESELTKSAPDDFPGKLSESGHPVDVDKRLDYKIALAEVRIAKVLGESPAFESALRSSKKAREFEEEFVMLEPTLHSRWLDLRTPAIRALRRGRLAYLEKLIEGIACHHDDPDS